MKFGRILLTLGLAGMLVSCGGSEPNTLFDTASPESSVMNVYVSDEETTTSYWLLDDPLEHEILGKMKETAANPADVTTEDVTFPVYGFEIGTTDGLGLNMAWSNGYLYNRDGAVYEFDFDFGKLLKDYGFEERDVWQDRHIVCERYLVLDENGWNADLMKSVDEDPSAPEGITLEATRENEKIHAVFRNGGTEDWYFGTYYSLHVQLGDGWYHVPVSPEENWAFYDIGYEIQPGGEWEETYNLMMYGDLPVGHYRLFAYGLTWEFDV